MNFRLLTFLTICLLCQPLYAVDFDPSDKSILELQVALSSGQTSSVELVDFYLDRIARFDRKGPSLNSMAVVNPAAREDAAVLDRERKASGPRGPLHGIPIVVKDNYQTRGMPTTAGSVTLAGFAPDEDAEMVRRLRAAGVVILGKTNMHEFAYGTETLGSAFGATRNPYDPTRNPGGSSGGTGAAVAANFAVAGLGSDTCGSIRIPAAHNSLVGLRGTQGAASRTGIIPLSATQDIGGPLAHNVTDLALLLDVTTGYDPADPQTAAVIGHFNTPFTDSLNPDALRGKRVGVVGELRLVDQEDEEVARVFDAAMEQVRALGADVMEVSLANLDSLVFEVNYGYYVLQHDFFRDINAYLAAHQDAPIGNIEDILASDALSAQIRERVQQSVDFQNDPPELYLSEFAKREKLKVAIYELMASAGLDALAYPTMRRKAALVGEENLGETCRLASNSGLPAITVPAGVTPDGLPVGLELLGRAWDDASLLGLAYAFEQATHHRNLPPLVGNPRSD